jgi:multiple sugar transport system ATP-binding protein
MTMADRIVVLNDRRIEQVGTPMEVYRRPATAFVASFVGTPRINLVPATVTGRDGRAMATLPDGTQIATAIAASRLPQDGAMTLGLRPESLRIVESEGTQAKVRVVERLGERTLAYVELADGTLLTAEDRGDSTLQPGQNVALGIDGSAAHLFDAAGTGFHAEAP